MARVARQIIHAQLWVHASQETLSTINGIDPKQLAITKLLYREVQLEQCRAETGWTPG